MIKLKSFTALDFGTFISWIDNSELLVTIAGTYFSYPLTVEQLHAYLEDENSTSFNVVNSRDDKIIGHAEIVVSGKDTFKIDKLIIGDKSNRGKGIGQEVINELLTYAFTRMDAKTVELNVFDWNTAGIRCYEKCGFVINPQKQTSFQVGGNSWTALNMTMEKNAWAKGKAANSAV